MSSRKARGRKGDGSLFQGPHKGTPVRFSPLTRFRPLRGHRLTHIARLILENRLWRAWPDRVRPLQGIEQEVRCEPWVVCCGGQPRAEGLNPVGIRVGRYRSGQLPVAARAAAAFGVLELRPERVLAVGAGAGVFEEDGEVGFDEAVGGRDAAAVEFDGEGLFEVDELGAEPDGRLSGLRVDGEAVSVSHLCAEGERPGAAGRGPVGGRDHRAVG